MKNEEREYINDYYGGKFAGMVFPEKNDSEKVKTHLSMWVLNLKKERILAFKNSDQTKETQFNLQTDVFIVDDKISQLNKRHLRSALTEDENQTLNNWKGIFLTRIIR